MEEILGRIERHDRSNGYESNVDASRYGSKFKLWLNQNLAFLSYKLFILDYEAATIVEPMPIVTTTTAMQAIPP